ncbi:MULTISPECIES: PAS domain-containing sensor histidine kinase [Mesorhizobium]|uniref:PAS domain-containing sensor histidine kinase n=1 Tax=Mesorhizobium TaxID=68287 RepID=UPI0010A96B81|nr:MULTISPECIES: PAS domain-containing protein [Mesorhizobium]
MLVQTKGFAAMEISSSFHPRTLAFAIGGAGVILGGLSGEPSGLLAALPALCFYAGRWSCALSIAVCGIAFAFIVLPAGDPTEPIVYLKFAAFLATAFAINWVVRDYRRATSSRLTEHEARLIVESMPGLGWSTDPKGNFMYVNPSVIDYVGKPSQDLDRIESSDSFGWEQVVHPEDAERAAKAWLGCLQTGEPYEVDLRVRRFDGSYRWFRASGRPSRDGDGQVIGWYGTTIDIEDRKRAEEALRRSEQQLRTLIDTMPALAWSSNAAGEPTYFSKRTLEYVGLSSEELFRASYKMMHPDDVPGFKQAWARSIETGQTFELTYRLRRADGEYRWNQGRAEPLRDENGAIIQWYGVNIDADERVRAEEALRQGEQQLRRMIDAIPVYVWCATPEGVPSYMNKKLIQYAGLTLGDLDNAIQLTVHPDDISLLTRNLTHSFRTGEPFLMKYRHRRYDDVYRWVDGRAEPLRDESGLIVQWYGVLIDIEDEMRTQETLREAQDKLSRSMRAATLAELSASIAHEINQPLAAVVANGHACQRWLSAQPPNVERARISAERIIRDANGAAEVISRIRALFKQKVVAREAVDINQIILEVCRLLGDRFSANNVSVKTDLKPGLPHVSVDRVQIQQVVANLIRNGIDAMESSIEALKSLLIRSWRDGTGMVLVEVRDQGHGLKDRERIFEPFFTTKEDGMGMGLAICRSIVEAHNGRLWAAPTEPTGTAFTFALPASGGDLR